MLYTTNAMESLNSGYRRLNRSRSVFPNDMSLLKALYIHCAAHILHRSNLVYHSAIGSARSAFKYSFWEELVEYGSYAFPV